MAPSQVNVGANDHTFIPTMKAAISSASILKLDGESQHDIVLRTFRCLIADLCEQFKGGHPG